MENSSTKNELFQEWSSFLSAQADWKLFLTVTFRDFHSREMVTKKIRSLVQILNRDLFGNHYTRIVGHSYFAYAYALENQKRGALHVHWLVDRPVRFELIHSVMKIWDGHCQGVVVSDMSQVSYVAKYVTKGGDVEVYKPRVYKNPSFVPMWFSKAELILRRS